VAQDSILIVDDNPANTRLISFLLTSRGYQVRTASNADETLNLIEEQLPRLILMDIQLPGMDGLTLTRKLKENARTRDVIIVALSAYAMKGDEEKAIAAGCDGYITKPVDTRSFPGQIAEHLRAARTAERPFLT